jgi:TPR repeat protein
MRLAVITVATLLLAGCSAPPQHGASALRATSASAVAQRAGALMDYVLTRVSALASIENWRGRQASPEEIRALASNGDTNAMVQLAQMYRTGANGLPRDERQMVVWLRRASELENATASYALYLHYLHLGLDRQAVHYENIAIRQGYALPPRLDPRRG